MTTIKRIKRWCEHNPRKARLIFIGLAGFILGFWLAGCANIRETIKTADAVIDVIEEKKKQKEGEEVTVIRAPKKKYRTCSRMVSKGSLWWKKEEVETSVQYLYPDEKCSWGN